MLEIQNTIEIDAPAETVWKKLAKLDDVQHWARAVTKAYYHTAQTSGVGAGRTCEVDGFGTLVEEIVDWGEGQTLTYRVEGMPSFIEDLRNTWRIDEVGADRSVVTSTLFVSTKYGPIGTLIERVMLKPRMGKLIAGGLKEFKYYVEQGRAYVGGAAEQATTVTA